MTSQERIVLTTLMRKMKETEESLSGCLDILAIFLAGDDTDNHPARQSASSAARLIDEAMWARTDHLR